jgi:hypothetical protein
MRSLVRQEAAATVEDVSAARDRAKAAVQNLTAEVDELRVAHVRSGRLPPTSTRGSRTVLNYGLFYCAPRMGGWLQSASVPLALRQHCVSTASALRQHCVSTA